MDGAPIHGTHATSACVTVRFHEPKKFKEARPRSYTGPRHRSGSFDAQNLLEDVTRRISGMSVADVRPLLLTLCTLFEDVLIGIEFTVTFCSQLACHDSIESIDR